MAMTAIAADLVIGQLDTNASGKRIITAIEQLPFVHGQTTTAQVDLEPLEIGDTAVEVRRFHAGQGT